MVLRGMWESSLEMMIWSVKLMVQNYLGKVIIIILI